MPKPQIIEINGPDHNMYKFMTFHNIRENQWIMKGTNIKLDLIGSSYDEVIDKAFNQLNSLINSNGRSS